MPGANKQWNSTWFLLTGLQIKSTMKYQNAPTRMKKNESTTVRQPELSCRAGGSVTWSDTLENRLASSTEVGHMHIL